MRTSRARTVVSVGRVLRRARGVRVHRRAERHGDEQRGQPAGWAEPGAEAGQVHAFPRVPTFPDPSTSGGIDLTGTGLNPQSPAFQAARQACKSYFPNAGRTRTLTAAQKRAALAFAQCMRAHGEPDFPDPTTTFSRSTPVVAVDGMVFPVGPGLDPSSPAFRGAANACGVSPPPG